MTLKQRLNRRAALLVGAALFCLCVWAFFEIAEDYPEGQFTRWDYGLLRWFRTTADDSIPRGPKWLGYAMRDASALGSAVVLALTVGGVAGYLLISRRRREGLAVALACGGGLAVGLALKALAARPRPSVVPHLVEVSSSSFPSGHSMQAAIVYLTLGTLVAHLSHSPQVRIYAVALAGFLTFLVGLTRVYLGVHYPTDVVAGWAAGTAWALLCAAIFSRGTSRTTPSQGA